MLSEINPKYVSSIKIAGKKVAEEFCEAFKIEDRLALEYVPLVIFQTHFAADYALKCHSSVQAGRAAKDPTLEIMLKLPLINKLAAETVSISASFWEASRQLREEVSNWTNVNSGLSNAVEALASYSDGKLEVLTDGANNRQESKGGQPLETDSDETPVNMVDIFSGMLELADQLRSIFSEFGLSKPIDEARLRSLANLLSAYYFNEDYTENERNAAIEAVLNQQA